MWGDRCPRQGGTDNTTPSFVEMSGNPRPRSGSPPARRVQDPSDAVRDMVRDKLAALGISDSSSDDEEAGGALKQRQQRKPLGGGSVSPRAPGASSPRSVGVTASPRSSPAAVSGSPRVTTSSSPAADRPKVGSPRVGSPRVGSPRTGLSPRVPHLALVPREESDEDKEEKSASGRRLREGKVGPTSAATAAPVVVVPSPRHQVAERRSRSQGRVAGEDGTAAPHSPRQQALIAARRSGVERGDDGNDQASPELVPRLRMSPRESNEKRTEPGRKASDCPLDDVRDSFAARFKEGLDDSDGDIDRFFRKK